MKHTNNTNTNNTNPNGIELNARKTMLELYDEVNKDGVKLTYVKYDGVSIGILGYLNEADRKAAEATLKKLSNEVSSPWELMTKLSELTAIADSGVTPDEEVEVNGQRCYISYATRALYMSATMEKAVDLDDLKCDLPPEAIKTLLMERAGHVLASTYTAPTDDDGDDEEEVDICDFCPFN